MIANVSYAVPGMVGKLVVPREDAIKVFQEFIPRGYIVKALEERAWTGLPSVTMLAHGERETWLKITEPYTLDLDTTAWMIFGTAGHYILDDGSENNEVKLSNEFVYGTTDCISGNRLWDFKFTGSYKAAKALGITKVAEEIKDENGNVILYKTGEKAGQVKTRQVVSQGTQSDIDEWIMQLNCYKYLYEQTDDPITELAIFMIVRDAGTMEAKNRGIMRPFYKVSIPILETEVVRNYIESRSKAIQKYFISNTLPPLCDKIYTWDGRKCCSEYCAVYNNCRMHMENTQ